MGWVGLKKYAKDCHAQEPSYSVEAEAVLLSWALVGAVRAMPFANVHHIIIVSRMGWR